MRESVYVTKINSQFGGETKRKKLNGSIFGFFYQNLNGYGWLLKKDTFNVRNEEGVE